MGCCQGKQQASQPGQAQPNMQQPPNGKQVEQQIQQQNLQKKPQQNEEINNQQQQKGQNNRKKHYKQNSMPQGVNPNVNGVGGDTTMIEESKIMSLNQSRRNSPKKNGKKNFQNQGRGKQGLFDPDESDFTDLNQIGLIPKNGDNHNNGQQQHDQLNDDSEFYSQQDGEESESFDKDDDQEHGNNEQYMLEEEEEDDMDDEELEEEFEEEMEEDISENELQHKKNNQDNNRELKAKPQHQTQLQLQIPINSVKQEASQQNQQNNSNKKHEKLRIPPSPIKIQQNNKDNVPQKNFQINPSPQPVDDNNNISQQNSENLQVQQQQNQAVQNQESSKKKSKSRQKSQIVQQQETDPKILINGEIVNQDPDIQKIRQKFLKNKALSYNDGRKKKKQDEVQKQNQDEQLQGGQLLRMKSMNTQNKENKINEHQRDQDQESNQMIDEQIGNLRQNSGEQESEKEIDKQQQPQSQINNSSPQKNTLSPNITSQSQQQFLQPDAKRQINKTLSKQTEQQNPQEKEELQEEEKKDNNQSEQDGDSPQDVKKYFENDNKDRYFTREQLEFYEKIYKPKMKKPERKFFIKNFKKSDMLGTGSFGTVYKGFDNDHGLIIAVKTVPLSKFQNTIQDKKIKALMHEIDLLRTLNHKNIVKYLGSQQAEDCINIFLEFVSGGSLERIYKVYPMNETLLRRYTKQILEGLEYLHVNNVIHRDIKAANILLDSQGTCKLADFGSSKKYVSMGQQFNSFCGTPYWMAPEVIRQSGHNRYADIWSLGCTVLEMIQGRPPWSDKNNISVLLAIADAKEPPKYPKTLSPDLKNFLDCCFKRDPYQRANVYELLRHPFINVQTKLQKYHFALDKIEEENTPGPTPSEYSKKIASSRSGGISSDGLNANSGGKDAKKKPGKFFPSIKNDQIKDSCEKIDEEDENKASVASHKINQSQDSQHLSASNANNLAKNLPPPLPISEISQNQGSKPNSKRGKINLEVKRLDDPPREKLQEQIIVQESIKISQMKSGNNSTNNVIQSQLNQSKRKILEGKKDSDGLIVVPQKLYTPNLNMIKKEGSFKNIKTSNLKHREEIKSPDFSSMKDGSMFSPSQNSKSPDDRIFEKKSQQITNPQETNDINNQSFGNRPGSASKKGMSVLESILQNRKQSNNPSLNSSQIIKDMPNKNDTNTSQIISAQQVSDIFKKQGEIKAVGKGSGKVFKLDKSKLNISGNVDKSILEQINQTPTQSQQNQVNEQQSSNFQTSNKRRVQYQIDLKSTKDISKIQLKPSENRLLDIIEEVRKDEGIDVNSYHLPDFGTSQQTQNSQKIAPELVHQRHFSQDIQQNPSQLSKVEEFRMEAQRKILKDQKKKSLQPIDTSSNKDIVRQIKQNSSTTGVKDYLRPQLPNVTEECMSGTSNFSYMSIKKEMRKKLQTDILADIAKEVNKQSSASPPSKTILQGGSKLTTPQNESQLDQLSEDDESMDSNEYESPNNYNKQINQQTSQVQFQQQQQEDYIDPNNPAVIRSRRSSLLIIKQKTQNEPKKTTQQQDSVDEDEIKRRKSQFWKLKTVVDIDSDAKEEEQNGFNLAQHGMNRGYDYKNQNKSSMGGISEFPDESLKISQNQPSHIDGGGQNNDPTIAQSPNRYKSYQKMLGDGNNAAKQANNVQNNNGGGDENKSALFSQQDYEYDDEEQISDEESESAHDNPNKQNADNSNTNKKQDAKAAFDVFASGSDDSDSDDSSSGKESARMDTEEMEQILKSGKHN
eukprot:403373756